MEIKYYKTSEFIANEGQVEGLPSNPRQWTKEELDKLAKSLTDTPELFEARPLLAYPHEGKYIVLGGNMRLEASKKNKAKQVPAIIFPADTPTEKLREIVIKDNSSFGDWDYDELANKWDDLPLCEWGVPAWDTNVNEEGDGLPAELDGLDLTPDKLETLGGSDAGEKKRVIICYDADEEDSVASLLGVETIDRIIYDINEIQVPNPIV